MNISTMFLLLRNSSDCCLFAFASLPHMSIAGRVILTVTFQKVDAAPNTQRTAEAHNDSLQSSNRTIEKFHKFTSIILD